MFTSLEKQSLVDLEEEVLAFWKEHRIFERSLEEREDSVSYSFFDGPPFATGLPHYGHILAGTIKDAIGRYKTMKGFYVPRRFGWDCHGLPVENEVEKGHGLSGRGAIMDYGIPKFNEECRKIVLRYSEEWKSVVTRLGRWVDFEKTYRTMDFSYMESVWWVFAALYRKDLIYKGFKVMPFSTKLGTPLSNFEANLNYREVDDPSIVAEFPLKDSDVSLLVWTTTPWTLPANLAVCVAPEIDYVKIAHKGKKYLLAKDRLTVYFKDPKDYEVLEEVRGKDLEGMTYHPPFDYFIGASPFRVLLADFVTTTDGTGIVHAAPGFGEDDFFVCQKAGIEPVCPVDQNGCYTDAVSDYRGVYVKDADKEIIATLKRQGKLFYRGTCRHRYPFCWRSDTPLIYRLTDSWFVAVEKIKDKMIAINERIHWMPSHIKKGRFGKWLEGARDWAVSRYRYWGTPIPVWEAEDGERIVIGSVEEVKKYTKTSPEDLHLHFIDTLEFTDERGKKFRRTEGVFDCWFESGSMPYAQNHYPFENADLFRKTFPADFIAEGIDQTRGWFYTLTVLAAALFDSSAFENVVVNGIVLAEDGQKMSKRLKNYPDPMNLVQVSGADALRLYLLQSPVVKGEDMCFREKGVEQTFRSVLLPFWNAHNFFVTYAKIYNWNPEKDFRRPAVFLDGWITSLLHRLIQEVEKALDVYDLSEAVEPITRFIDGLTNWYIRRSRRRFWNAEACADRDEAFSTLYTVLRESSKVMAPFIPFLTETVYRNLRTGEKEAPSVHLCDYPAYQKDARDLPLEGKMEALQTAVNLGHALRKEHKIKVRQPLLRLHIALGDSPEKDFLIDQVHLIREELNVKEVLFHGDERELVDLKMIPNFRVLGKKVGKRMPAVRSCLEQLGPDDVRTFFKEKKIEITVEGERFALEEEDIQWQREVKEGMVAVNRGVITVALDTMLTPVLVEEGKARELVNKIQTMRKEAGLEKTDRIEVRLTGSEAMRQSFLNHDAYIQGETLAVRVIFEKNIQGTAWDINGEEVFISIRKVLS